jgi:DNA-damage-inducible protein D
MAKKLKLEETPNNLFEQIRKTDENGNEFWMARKLAKILEYSDFRNFLSVIEKAKTACINSGQLNNDHLVEATEVVDAGSGATHSYPSYKLSRYACYLIVQNADPSKEVVAMGQISFGYENCPAGYSQTYHCC